MKLRPVLLASASPQRLALLRQLGVDVTVRPTDVAELAVGEPITVARANAQAKFAAAHAATPPGDHTRLLVACDTLVALADGTILGKPTNRDEARQMLEQLSGAWHEVHSGLATGFADGAGSAATVVHETTRVQFANLTDAEIRWYLDHDDWAGRAGGYAIQAFAAAFVRRIDGDYTNVVGLPVPLLWRHLRPAPARPATAP